MTFIYDIEVFVEDWVVVFKSIENPEKNPVVIVNSPHKLRSFILKHDVVLCGFNNKHYDDWVIQTMLNGGTNTDVKKHNDFIIAGGNGWEFPFIQYKKKPFKSIDLRDDLPIGLSLKAIEGNIGESIVESKIDFTIKRKLTPEEIKEVIRYCITDVENTFKLYQIRRSYIESKRAVARIKGMDGTEAMTLTNAKLTAKFLDAKRKTYDDEFEYTPPKELRIKKYTEPLEFFKVIDYKKKLKINIAGVPHVYGWGGIHGAIKNYINRGDPDHKIVTIDVGSYYPSLMLQYNYISRSIPSSQGYKVVYDTRMTAKHTGDKETANALKLVLNTCYGAMKNQYNDLYDPHNANAICITGMLLLTDLIEKLEQVPSFELIQSNTDGIIIRYHNDHELMIEKIVREWEKRTRMNMEYTVIHAIAQKDVNNYVMKSGETYLVTEDEAGNLTHNVTEKDKGKLKSKGSYVSLYGGGDFKNNSMIVLHNAVVNYFMDGVPIEDTIEQDNNVMNYQMIAKTGSTYDGTFHEVNGNKIPIQRVNRVYATNNVSYGTIYKRKNGKDSKAEALTDGEEKGRNDKIASLPDHCIIDNENSLSIGDIDKSFYIDLARKRINDYVGVKQPKKPKKSEPKQKRKAGTTMAETKAKSTATINSKLLEVAKIMHGYEWEKDGKNMHQQYKYVTEAQYKNYFKKALDSVGLVWESNCIGYEFINTISDKMHLIIATFKATILDAATGESREYQYIGSGADNGDKALYKAYTGGLKFFLSNMYLVAENNDPENDAPQGQTPQTTTKKSTIPVSSEKREEIKKELTNPNGKADDNQLQSITRALKEIRSYYRKGKEVFNDDLYRKYEAFVSESIIKQKSSPTKAEVEEILTTARQKINELKKGA